MRAYMLQPYSSQQAHQNNWYNVSYRRTGTYKGIGQIPVDGPVGSIGGSSADTSNMAAQAGLCLSADQSGYVNCGSAAPGTVLSNVPGASSYVLAPSISLGTGISNATMAQLAGYLPLIIGGLVVILLATGGRK